MCTTTSHLFNIVCALIDARSKEIVQDLVHLAPSNINYRIFQTLINTSLTMHSISLGSRSHLFLSLLMQLLCFVGIFKATFNSILPHIKFYF